MTIREIVVNEIVTLYRYSQPTIDGVCRSGFRGPEIVFCLVSGIVNIQNDFSPYFVNFCIVGLSPINVVFWIYTHIYTSVPQLKKVAFNFPDFFSVLSSRCSENLPASKNESFNNELLFQNQEKFSLGHLG